MALQLFGAASRALPSVTSRSRGIAQKLFRGGTRKPQPQLADTPVQRERPGVGERVIDLSRKAAVGTASTAASVGTFIAADALLSEEDLQVDAEIVDEDVRPSNTVTVYEAKHDPSSAVETPRREDNHAADHTPHIEGRLEREFIAYASEMVMQKVDASPLLDQVSFLTSRYQLSRDEAFDIAGGVQMYRFHPEVVAIVAAVSSFNTRGTLLLGAQRADRGV